MTSTTTIPDEIRTAKRLMLSQGQAHSLARLVGDFLSQYEGQADELDELHRRLGDAFELARWRREDVKIELEPVQVIDLLKAVVMMLEDREWTECDRQALQAACRQLSELAFAPGLVAVGTRGPHAQFNRLELRVTEVLVRS